MYISRDGKIEVGKVFGVFTCRTKFYTGGACSARIRINGVLEKLHYRMSINIGK